MSFFSTNNDISNKFNIQNLDVRCILLERERDSPFKPFKNARAYMREI